MRVMLCVNMFVGWLLLGVAVGSGASYKDKDKVRVVATKVGPYANPSETYEYFSVPFCPSSDSVADGKLSHNLGEILSGDRKVLTNYGINFKVPVESKRLCSKVLTVQDVELFHQTINEDYYFEMLVDNLPVWGYIGGIETPATDLLTRTDINDKNLAFENLAGKKIHIYTFSV
mmetsp:Transcript_15995/g.25065  ORF Transcript_15995/g.25065 Transcript_15995/m.25065 type:complete len:174 (+) Transcript_15995:88-609(+)